VPLINVPPSTDTTTGMLARLSFNFEPKKLGSSLAVFAKTVNDLTKLKAAKLLYFADKMHLLQYGRPITGDKYYCLDYGPVPTVSLNIMSDMISPFTVTLKGKRLEHPMRSTVEEYVTVGNKSARHPRIIARKDSEIDSLTSAEQKVLTYISQKYGQLSSSRLIELTHKERPWLKSNERRPEGSSVEIPWEYFFDESSPDTTPILSHVAELAENRAFLKALHEDL
jgi:uncharacterized phage-associated protein